MATNEAPFSSELVLGTVNLTSSLETPSKTCLVEKSLKTMDFTLSIMILVATIIATAIVTYSSIVAKSLIFAGLGGSIMTWGWMFIAGAGLLAFVAAVIKYNCCNSNNYISKREEGETTHKGSGEAYFYGKYTLRALSLSLAIIIIAIVLIILILTIMACASNGGGDTDCCNGGMGSNGGSNHCFFYGFWLGNGSWSFSLDSTSNEQSSKKPIKGESSSSDIH